MPTLTIPGACLLHLSATHPIDKPNAGHWYTQWMRWHNTHSILRFRLFPKTDPRMNRTPPARLKPTHPNSRIPAASPL